MNTTERYNFVYQHGTERPTSVVTLPENLIIVLLHIQGCHLQCKKYFCKIVGLCTEEFKKISNSAVFKELNKVGLSPSHKSLSHARSVVIACWLSKVLEDKSSNEYLKTNKENRRKYEKIKKQFSLLLL